MSIEDKSLEINNTQQKKILKIKENDYVLLFYVNKNGGIFEIECGKNALIFDKNNRYIIEKKSEVDKIKENYEFKRNIQICNFKINI